MRLVGQLLFSFFFFLPLLFGQAIQQVSFHEFQLHECLLPEDHPLQVPLNDLFQDRGMFQSMKHFRKAGFHLRSRNEQKIMVASHPALKDYLIKKFCDAIPQQDQLSNYLKRITGARALQKFIQVNHLEHVVVPQKWLYPLPEIFSDHETEEATYILVVEDMKICSGKGKPYGETAKRYYNIEKETLRELCLVVFYFRGLDSGPCNLPFTYDNKIAFIDTECWNEWDRQGFLPRILPYLNSKQKKYALQVFGKLSSFDNQGND